MKKTLIVAATCVLMSPLYAAENNYAVAEFKAINTSAAEASLVAELLRSYLVNNGIAVVDRANMDMLLAEQGLQFSGCTESDCAVQMGKILNVQKIIVGMLSKMGNMWIITANIIGFTEWTKLARAIYQVSD